MLSALLTSARADAASASPASLATDDGLDARVAASIPPAAIDGAAADALDAGGGASAAATRVVALALLADAAALPPGDLAARVRGCGLPARLAGALAAAPATALIGGGGGSSVLGGPAAALEAEAALALLARCAASPAASGGPAAAATELSALARCAALDVEPEDAPPAGTRPRAGGARSALARVFPAALRLAALRLATHAASPDVVDAAAGFVRARRRAIVRALSEACAPGPSPAGRPELTQAALALTLLARLAAAPGGDAALGDATVAELRAAASRVAAVFFAVDARGAVPAAARLAAAREAGVAPDQRDEVDELAGAVRRVRLAAAAYVWALVARSGGGGGGAANASSPPPLILRAAPPPSGTAPRLSLISVKDALFQAAEDLYAASDARRAALASLAAPPARADDPTDRAASDRGAALGAAAAADAAVRGTLRLAETCLAIVHHTLRTARAACGSDADRAQLARVLAPALDHLARLPEDGEGRAAALGALARRVEAEVGEG